VIGSKGLVQISLATLASSATQVALSGSDPAITIPTTVTIPAGSLTQDVAFTIGSSFNSTHVFWIQGTTAGSSAIAYGTQVTAKGQYGVALYINNSTEVTLPGLTTGNYQLGMNSLAGYSTSANLTCHGLPTGASCQFGTNALMVPAGGSASTSVVINTTSSTPLGQYPFTIQASDGVVTSTVAATLGVGDYSVSITPSSRIVLQNTTASYTVNVTSIDNYSGNFTGTCSGIPSPAVCSVNGFFAGWTASIQTNNLAVGNYSFTVELSNGAATRSASAQLSIGDFNATLSGNSLSVGVGQSGNITVNVTGQNGFADAVALACNGAPTGTTCAVNPASVIPSSGGAPDTVTVTVSTKPAMKNSRQSKTAGARAGIVGISSLFFGLLAVLTLGRRKAESLCASIALLALIAVVASCGGVRVGEVAAAAVAAAGAVRRSASPFRPAPMG